MAAFRERRGREGTEAEGAATAEGDGSAPAAPARAAAAAPELDALERRLLRSTGARAAAAAAEPELDLRGLQDVHRPSSGGFETEDAFEPPPPPLPAEAEPPHVVPAPAGKGLARGQLLHYELWKVMAPPEPLSTALVLLPSVGGALSPAIIQSPRPWDHASGATPTQCRTQSGTQRPHARRETGPRPPRTLLRDSQRARALLRMSACST